jgi:hypothetical protein
MTMTQKKPKYADKNVGQNHYVHHIAWLVQDGTWASVGVFTNWNTVVLYIKHSFSSHLTENSMRTWWKYQGVNAVQRINGC